MSCVAPHRPFAVMGLQGRWAPRHSRRHGLSISTFYAAFGRLSASSRFSYPASRAPLLLLQYRTGGMAAGRSTQGLLYVHRHRLDRRGIRALVLVSCSEHPITSLVCARLIALPTISNCRAVGTIFSGTVNGKRVS